MAALEQMFEDLEPGSVPNLRHFLKEAAYKYKVGMGVYVRKPSLHVWEFLTWEVISSFFCLDMFKSLSKHVRQLFKSEKLRKLLEFPVLFLGATPQNTPAMYSLMNYADLGLGTWYPDGGMFKIVEGMTSLARELGVQFEMEQEALRIETDKDRATAVSCKGGRVFTADIIVGACDYHHTETRLLPEPYRNYTDKYWDTRTMAPSSLLWYLGINKRLQGLLHHNLFFDEDLGRHAQEIYENPQWPSKPLFYVSAPSVTDSSVAPEACENLFVLVPVAPDLEDTPEIRERYFSVIMDRLESLIRQ